MVQESQLKSLNEFFNLASKNVRIDRDAGAAQISLTEYPEFIHGLFLSNSQQSLQTISGKSLIVVIKLN
jgi:hypothetical protein